MSRTWATRVFSAVVAALVAVACCGIVVGPAHSADIPWSAPINLSRTPQVSIHPSLVADGYGNIHVFWSEAMTEQREGSAELAATPDTIVYSRWDGQAWTEPIDILAVNDDTVADFVAASVDGEDRLHLVWTGLMGIYYSSVLVTAADQVRSWATPHVISFDSARSRYGSDIAVDDEGNVHVVYATRGAGAGVFHTMKAYDSQDWGLPSRISDSLRDIEVTFNDVRLLIDASERLHVAWGTTNTNGYNQAVYYARGETSGQAWEAPVLLADATINTGFTGYPSLLAYGPNELLLIHVDQENRGRIERTSFDGGRTWTEARFILPSMMGVNGFLVPLLDGGGGLHLVINMRPSSNQRTGIYYAPRAGLDWSPIETVAAEAPHSSAAHYTDAAIRLGNEIHVVWTQLGSNEIWHTRGIINELQPLPAQEMPEIVEPTPTATEIVRVTELAQGSSDATYAPASPRPPTPRTWVPAVAAAVPVFLLVSGVVVWRVRKR